MTPPDPVRSTARPICWRCSSFVRLAARGPPRRLAARRSPRRPWNVRSASISAAVTAPAAASGASTCSTQRDSRRRARKYSQAISRKPGSPLMTLCAMIVRQKPPARHVLEPGRVPDEVHGPGAREGEHGERDAACTRYVRAADQVADPEPDQPGVRRVAPDAAHQPAHEEELPDDVRLAEAVACEGRVREVLEVLDDLEPEPDERAVDEAVDRRVDLRRRRSARATGGRAP